MKKSTEIKALTQVGVWLEDFQVRHKYTDEVMAEKLGFDGQTVVSLIKSGHLMPSHKLFPRLCDLLGFEMRKVMEMAMSDSGKDVVWNLHKNLAPISMSEDQSVMLGAYQAVLTGDKTTKRVKVPGATMFLVPDDQPSGPSQ